MTILIEIPEPEIIEVTPISDQRRRHDSTASPFVDHEFRDVVERPSLLIEDPDRNLPLIVHEQGGLIRRPGSLGIGVTDQLTGTDSLRAASDKVDELDSPYFGFITLAGLPNVRDQILGCCYVRNTDEIIFGTSGGEFEHRRHRHSIHAVGQPDVPTLRMVDFGDPKS